MKIYGIPISPFVRKVIIAAELKNLNYEIIPILPFDKPTGFEKISPLGKIPVIVDNDITLADSNVICSYLDEKYPQYPLLPQDINIRAKARWLEKYSDTKLAEITVFNLFFEKKIKPVVFNKQVNEKLISTNIEKYIPKEFDYLESQLGATKFLFSDKNLTITDIAIASNLLNASYADFEIDKSKWPNLSAYITNLHNLEVFKKCKNNDQLFLDKL